MRHKYYETYIKSYKFFSITSQYAGFRARLHEFEVIVIGTIVSFLFRLLTRPSWTFNSITVPTFRLCTNISLFTSNVFAILITRELHFLLNKRTVHESNSILQVLGPAVLHACNITDCSCVPMQTKRARDPCGWKPRENEKSAPVPSLEYSPAFSFCLKRRQGPVSLGTWTKASVEHI